MESQPPRDDNETGRKMIIKRNYSQPSSSDNEIYENLSGNNNDSVSQEVNSDNLECDETIEDPNEEDIRKFIMSYKAFHALMKDLNEPAYFEQRLNAKHEVIESDLCDYLGELAYRRGEEIEALKQKAGIDQLQTTNDEPVDDSSDKDQKMVDAPAKNNDEENMEQIKISDQMNAAVDEDDDEINPKLKKLKMMDTMYDDDKGDGDKEVKNKMAAFDVLMSVIIEDSHYQSLEKNVQTNDQ